MSQRRIAVRNSMRISCGEGRTGEAVVTVFVVRSVAEDEVEDGGC